MSMQREQEDKFPAADIDKTRAKKEQAARNKAERERKPGACRRRNQGFAPGFVWK